jgi:hypothetical protein
MQVIDAVFKNTIDVKRARLILSALDLAERLSRRTHIGYCADSMVRDVPGNEIPIPRPRPKAVENETLATESEDLADAPQTEPESCPELASGEESLGVEETESEPKPALHVKRGRSYDSRAAEPSEEENAVAEADEARNLANALEGAQSGNLDDFKTILGAAGLLDADGHL